jgi:hypothetical protein
VIRLIAATPISAQSGVQISAPVPNAAVDRCAAEDRSAVADRCAVADHCAARVPNAAVDRCVVVDRYAAPVQTVVRVQNEVVPNAVRVVTQKDGDRSVEADLHVEVDRGVVLPNVAHCAAQNEVLRSEVQRVARNEVLPIVVQRVVRNVVTPNEVQRVARIGFHFLSHRPHALSHSRFLAGPARVSHLQAVTVAQRARADCQFPAQVEQQHPTAAAAQPIEAAHPTAVQYSVVRCSSAHCPANQRSVNQHWMNQRSVNRHSANCRSADQRPAC